MNNFRVVVLVLTVVVFTRGYALENKTENSQTPKVTRTVLHIARSLDPSKTEYLNVRSKNGDIATLIVKKREGKTTHAQQNSTEIRREDHKRSSPKIQDSPTLVRAPKSAVPPPVNIRSTDLFVKDSSSNKKKGRTLSTITIDNEGIPVVEGIRVPDDEKDKIETWRNARVINGILVPYKQFLSNNVPVINTDKKEVTLRGTYNTTQNTKPLSIFKDSDEIKTQWKGIAETLQSQPKTPIVVENVDQKRLLDYITLINNKEAQKRKNGRSVEFKPIKRMDENVDENGEPMFINQDPKEMWTEQGTIQVAQRRMMDEEADGEGKSLSASLPVEARDEDDSNLKPADQPRMLQSTGKVHYPPSSMYTAQGSRVSFEGVRTPVLQYAHPELGVQPAKAGSRPETVQIVSEKKSNLPPIKYFANDPHADRSPYAFEPGMTENTLTDNANYNAQEIANNIDNSNYDVTNIEFTTSSSDPTKVDITESPRRINGLYDRKTYEDTYGLGNDKYIKRYPYNGYSGNYPISKDDYYKWKMSGMGHGTNHKGYYVKVKDNRPFWEKIGDSIKETVQSGVDSVKDLTRPVVEPIVEATQKISENLGIQDATARISSTLGFNQGSGMRTGMQEKIGNPISTGSNLLPTIGVIAGGAALGLGALAVEKMIYNQLSMNLMRSEIGDPLSVEHKRALEAIANQQQIQQNGRPHSDSSAAEGRSLPPVENKPEKKDEFKRLIDESGIEGLERFNFAVDDGEEHQSHRRSLGSDTSNVSHVRQKRVRRSAYEIQQDSYGTIDNELSYGQQEQEFLSKLAELRHPNDWISTSCAKRIFCDVMLRHSHDSVLLMEKRMTMFLALSKPPVSDMVSKHIQQVLGGVRNRDCSPFLCLRHMPR